MTSEVVIAELKDKISEMQSHISKLEIAVSDLQHRASEAITEIRFGSTLNDSFYAQNIPAYSTSGRLVMLDIINSTIGAGGVLYCKDYKTKWGCIEFDKEVAIANEYPSVRIALDELVKAYENFKLTKALVTNSDGE